MGTLLVVTGPPAAGKSTVAQMVVRSAERSVLVDGDSFFGLLAMGAVAPWLPESNQQNTVVVEAAASAAGRFAQGGYTTVYEGVVGPWFLPTFGAATGLDRLEYVMLLPPVETCVQRVLTRRNHGFSDEAATRKMHAEFGSAPIAERHVVRDPPNEVAEVAAIIESARSTGQLTYNIH